MSQIIQTNSKDFITAVKHTINRTLRISRVDKAVTSIVSPIFNWGQRNSLFPLHFGIKCCALEFAAAFASRFDAERFGIVARSSPRQCDMLIVNGPVTKKLMKPLLTLYEQMPEPKWVIAMGECAIDGGPYYDAYGIIRGVDKIMPVDVYIPGCPPRPEAMLDGVLKLQRKIKKYHRQKFQL